LVGIAHPTHYNWIERTLVFIETTRKIKVDFASKGVGVASASLPQLRVFLPLEFDK
jgi:hypothetical protein